MDKFFTFKNNTVVLRLNNNTQIILQCIIIAYNNKEREVDERMGIIIHPPLQFNFYCIDKRSTPETETNP